MWLGLEKLHQLTCQGNYSLKITLTDFDSKTYVAIYDQFQVATMMTMIMIMLMVMLMIILMMLLQVGPGDDYVLTVGGFHQSLSTLGDSMAYHNGMKFSAK